MTTRHRLEDLPVTDMPLAAVLWVRARVGGHHVRPERPALDPANGMAACDTPGSHSGFQIFLKDGLGGQITLMGLLSALSDNPLTCADTYRRPANTACIHRHRCDTCRDSMCLTGTRRDRRPVTADHRNDDPAFDPPTTMR